MSDRQSDDGARLLDFSASLGRFVMLSPKGQLFALQQVQIAEDYSRISPRLCDVNFHAAASLATGLASSNLTLVVQPRADKAHAYFVTTLPAGEATKQVKLFQQPSEMIEASVAEGRFPIIVLAEVQQAIQRAKQAMDSPGAAPPPLPIPVRHLKLRTTAPNAWLHTLSDLFLKCAELNEHKPEVIEDKLDELRNRIKRTMVREFLTKCVWVDERARRIGRVTGSEDGSRFSTFITGDPTITDFAKALARKESGAFEGVTGFANVIPRPIPKLPWSAPTLHVYDAQFRTSNKLKEHYSVYAGLRALSHLGAPVLVHRPGVLDLAVPVMLLRPRRGSGGLADMSCRMFPLQHVVWNESTAGS